MQAIGKVATDGKDKPLDDIKIASVSLSYE